MNIISVINPPQETSGYCQIHLKNWSTEAKRDLRTVLAWPGKRGKEITDLPLYLQGDTSACAELREFLKTFSFTDINVWRWKTYPKNITTIIFEDKITWACDLINLIRAIATAYGHTRQEQAQLIFVGIDTKLEASTEYMISAWQWSVTIWANHVHPTEGMFQHAEDPANMAAGELKGFALESIRKAIVGEDTDKVLDASKCLQQMWYFDLNDNQKAEFSKLIINRLQELDASSSIQFILSKLATHLDLEDSECYTYMGDLF